MTTLLDLTRAVERFLVTWNDDNLQRLCGAVAAARVVLDDEHTRGRTEMLAAMAWAADEKAYKSKRGISWEHEHEHEKERFRLYARTILQSGLV